MLYDDLYISSRGTSFLLGLLRVPFVLIVNDPRRRTLINARKRCRRQTKPGPDRGIARAEDRWAGVGVLATRSVTRRKPNTPSNTQEHYD